MLWKKILLLAIMVSFLMYYVPIALDYIESHKFELSVLKKLNDIKNAGGDLGNDSSYGERQLIWKHYGHVFDRFPLFGTGSYNSTIWQRTLFPNSTVAGYSTHNLYIGIFIEHGYVGFLLFLFVVLKSIMIMFYKMTIREFYIYLIYILFPVLFINWNEYNLIPGQVFYWSTMLILLFPRTLK